MQLLAWRAGALCLLTAVVLGALEAHALRTRLAPEALDWIRTGLRYQAWHGLGLLGLGLLGGRGRARSLATLAMLGGVLIFSGSLYAMAFGAPRFLGAITPIGGSLFVLAWLALLFVVPPSRETGAAEELSEP